MSEGAYRMAQCLEGGAVQFDDIEMLRERHAAWRLLRALNAPLVLAFLGGFFVDGNRGASPASAVVDALDNVLYALNTDQDSPRYPKQPREYLEDWATPEAGCLRRFYPVGDDEVHYEVTPAFEKAYAWVESLKGRAFVGTESRLHIVVELLRQIVHGTDDDPQARLADLQRRRAEIDAEIAAVESGNLAMMDPTGVRDRYQQFSATARELLADFREVEENFRKLDRVAREKIAAWGGSKGELLADLVATRSDIAGSDQGRSFQGFYDFLLSESRQNELSDLLARVMRLDAITPDSRLRRVHHDWAEAAERAQRTVRQISEQLRRFLDDQVWLENRLVLDLVRAVETAALAARDCPPPIGLVIDAPGVPITLPLERPLYTLIASSEVESLIPLEDAAELDTDLLFTQTHIDMAALANRVRTVLPPRSSAELTDIVAMYPLAQGAAEIVGYLSLGDDDLSIDFDEAEPSWIEYADPDDTEVRKRAGLPKVTVSRR